MSHVYNLYTMLLRLLTSPLVPSRLEGAYHRLRDNHPSLRREWLLRMMPKPQGKQNLLLVLDRTTLSIEIKIIYKPQ